MTPNPSPFPDYRGKSFRVKAFVGPMNLTSNWGGGSRDYFALLSLATLRTMPVPENGNPFSNGGKTERVEQLPPNCAVVEHSLFCGKDLGITIFVGQENLAKLLPAPVAMTPDQKVVLAATVGLISSARFQEAEYHTGITRKVWDATKLELVAKGLLKPSGAVTDAGRNAIGDTRLANLDPKLNQQLAA